jgi:hypothetical protein
VQYLLNIQVDTWLAEVVAGGGFLDGLGLVPGVFTGLAALFGGLMSWSCMLAGRPWRTVPLETENPTVTTSEQPLPL